MDDLEQQLREALQRQEPPPWFRERVLAAAQSQPARAKRPWLSRIGFRLEWAAAFAASLVVTGGIWQWERSAQEREAGEAAKQRLKVALRITSTKLGEIQAKVGAISDGPAEVQ